MKAITIYNSAARTATDGAPVDQTNPQGNGGRAGRKMRGMIIVIDTTLVPGAAPSTVFTLEGKDPISGKYYTILASAAITAVGTVILRVFPGATVAANTGANDWIPAAWRIRNAHGNANSVTYSVVVLPLE